MASIGYLDLEFLHLGHQKDGGFDETDIADSDLRRLGVGRTLDAIASLKERGLITQNNDGAFGITSKARQILWDSKVPSGVRILRLLEIKAFSLSSITKYLAMDKEQAEGEIEGLRKKGLVLMSPQRTEKGLEKIFEIMDAGARLLERINSGGLKEIELFAGPPEKDVFETLDEIKGTIKGSALAESAKDEICGKIDQVRSRLKI